MDINDIKLNRVGLGYLDLSMKNPRFYYIISESIVVVRNNWDKRNICYFDIYDDTCHFNKEIYDEIVPHYPYDDLDKVLKTYLEKFKRKRVVLSNLNCLQFRSRIKEITFNELNYMII